MIEFLPAIALGVYNISDRTMSLANILGLPVLGKHYFNSALQPTFDLFAVNAPLLTKKTDDVPALANACAGPGSAGAVDWLYLTDASIGDGATFGGMVYRIETAGGKSSATWANSAAEFGVSYAAEY